MASRNDPQTLLAHVLMARIRQDTHPSVTQMTLVEQILPASLRREYIEMLIEKTLSARSPSIPMLRRIQRLVQEG